MKIAPEALMDIIRQHLIPHPTPQGQLGRMGEALAEVSGLGYVTGSQRDAANKIISELSGSTGWKSHGGPSDSATSKQNRRRASQL